MNSAADPFRHHPELRGQIADPLQSYMRTFTVEDLTARMREYGLVDNWWYPEEEREALRAQELRELQDDDLWVFGYGSLMWDPAFRFAEVRRAFVPGYARRFILKDIYGGRGTSSAPGLMAALDEGPGCDGLIFRIPRGEIEEETRVLWRRERIGPAYMARMVDAQFADGSARAITFVADHDSVLIDADLTREEQVRYVATGAGFMGTSLEYLRNVATKLSTLGIDDAEVDSLLREAEAYNAAL